MKKNLIILVGVLIAIDQVSKWFASNNLPFHQAVDVIPYFSLYLTHNKGIAFSLLEGLGNAGLISMTLLITIFMIYLWRRVPSHQQLASLGFALVISGAIGNLIDRATAGYVIDFFLFHTSNWAFAVFNIADSFITLGAIAIITEELAILRPKSQNSNSDS